MIRRIISVMPRHTKVVLIIVAGLTVVGMLAYGLFPVSRLAAPQWDVVVVDGHNNPVEGITVRETWQNYSVEMEGHETDRQTDTNGHATFPAQHSKYSVLRQVAGTASNFAHLYVHASYGPHATVFAFGKGLEGTATTGTFVTDWTGSPSLMRSRIVVRPTILPSSTESSVSQ
jgi:hypothetical protein